MSSSNVSLASRARHQLTNGKGIVAALLVLGGLVLPVGLSSFQLFLAGTFFILAALAVTWDFFTGLSGYFSFGHMFLVGLGGYSSVILEHELGLPLFVSIALATLITTVVGTAFLAGPSLRLAGIYFAAITLVVAIWSENLVILFSDVTGGLGGHLFVAPLGPELTGLLPVGASTDLLLYYFMFLNLLVITGVLLVVTKSEMGVVLRAIQQDELLLSSLGITPDKFKITAFAITAFFTGFTGAVWTHFLSSLTPATQLSLGIMIDILVAAVIGGLGTITGPIIGIFVLEFLDWALTTIQTSTLYQNSLGGYVDIREFRRVIWMSIAVVFFYFWPEGLYPRIRERIDRIDFGGEGDDR
jgi:branched-chain amino acid transport system permease protein